MERIRDLSCVRQHSVQRRPIRPGQVQSGPSNAITPVLWLIKQPLRGRFSGSAGSDVQQPAPGRVNDAGAPLFASITAPTAKQRLVKTCRVRCADPFYISVEQPLTPHQNRLARR